MVSAFFGHANFAATDGLAQKMLVILDGILKDGRAEFYLGGYGGFDHFAYQCCKKYKATHPDVSLLLILPYIPTRYRQEDLEEKKAQYDELIYPELENVPLRFAIDRRNKWIVDHADCIICWIDHDWGGAYQACRYARRKGKCVIDLYELQMDNKRGQRM